jgi:hypothetical protein
LAGHIDGDTIDFTDSSGVTWTSDLHLLDFTVGTDKLGFGDSAGLTSDQLADIDLAGYVATGLDPSGFAEFSEVPEPSQYRLMLVLFLWAALGWRRFSRSTTNL